MAQHDRSAATADRTWLPEAPMSSQSTASGQNPAPGRRRRRFRKPPVVEMLLSVQFKRLESFRVPHFGLLWQHFRECYPHTEERAPLEHTVERFDDATAALHQVALHLGRAFPLPRVWFLSDDRNTLLQIQTDCFVQNWRKRNDGDAYPRYALLRERFAVNVDVVARFLASEDLGRLEVDQCEITYINHIPIDERDPRLPRSAGDLARIFTFWSAETPDGAEVPERTVCTLSYPLHLEQREGPPVGRIHLRALPCSSHRADSAPSRAAIELQCTARGRPSGTDPDHALTFLDRAHDALVERFRRIIRPELQRLWEDGS